MGDAYADLIDATIQHLEGLKARGVRFVPVSPEALARLAQAPAPSGRPATVVPSRPVVSTKAPVVPPVPTAAAPIPETQPIVTAAPGPDGEARAAAFADLRQRAMACVKCAHLASSRKNVVFGVGNIHAELMFVGEAPGADEDAQAEPFVGKAGQLLTKIIETMGLSRASVYIANILKCRPDTPGQAAGNRKPTPEEMQTCIPYLHEQIDLIRPKVLVALGGTAVEGLLGKTVGITRLRGNWQTYRGTPLMPTYHPAFLLRNQDLATKRLVWEDMLQVMEKLGMAISEKQQRFFQKP
jgi:uracil-DNA glycosylase family 4